MAGIVSTCISLLAVLVSAFAIFQARKTALTGAYFSEMVRAYIEFLQSVSDFVYRRGYIERDELSAKVYKLSLFATHEIYDDAQRLYLHALHWAENPVTPAAEIDDSLYQLSDKMREHLVYVRNHGKIEKKMK